MSRSVTRRLRRATVPISVVFMPGSLGVEPSPNLPSPSGTSYTGKRPRRCARHGGRASLPAPGIEIKETHMNHLTQLLAEAGRASFLDDPEVDEQVARLYTSDVSGQGYVAHLTRVWANSPEALGALSYILKNAAIAAGLDDRTRALLVTACAATIGDSYCSLAYGSRLAREAGGHRGGPP